MEFLMVYIAGSILACQVSYKFAMACGGLKSKYDKFMVFIVMPFLSWIAIFVLISRLCAWGWPKK